MLWCGRGARPEREQRRAAAVNAGADESICEWFGSVSRRADSMVEHFVSFGRDCSSRL